MAAIPTGTGLSWIWQRIARPYDPLLVVEALLGLPHAVVRQLLSAVVATCDEAEDLLDAMPVTVRSLAIATTDQPERCFGEIRGPVLWSETMSARASTAGDPGVYVCAMPSKAFDTDENRVLVSALRAVRKAGREVERLHDAGYDDEVLRRARANGFRALRYLEHRTLSSVQAADRPTGRALRRTRSGTRRNTYRPALRMLERVSEPFSVDHVGALADDRTSAQHDLLAAIGQRLEARGIELGPFHPLQGGLVSGPLYYRHGRRRGERSMLHGVSVGSVLVDLPEPLNETDRDRATFRLTARAQGHPAVVVLDDADIDAAIDLAVAQGLDRSVVTR